MCHTYKHMELSLGTLPDDRATRVGQIESRPAGQPPSEDANTAQLLVRQDTNRKALGRRSQLEIRMDMLAAVKEGAEKPTQIMYKANLSWVALQTHLNQLLERGLLKWLAEGNRRRYVLTVKGANVMYSYIKVLEEIGEDTADYFLAGR